MAEGGAAPGGERTFRGTSPLRCVLAVVAAPVIAGVGFDLLSRWFRWRPIGPGLLPFDGVASSTDLLWLSVGLAAFLCALRARGVTRCRVYIAIGVGIALAATAARGAAPTLPFWLAAATVGGLTASGTWALLRPARRHWPVSARIALGLGVGALLLVFAGPMLLWLPAGSVRHLRRDAVPTADGGTVARYSWYIPGFVDAFSGNRVVYTPPGRWARAEVVVDLVAGDHLTGMRLFADGDRRGLIWEKAVPAAGATPAAKRVMFNVNWLRWANEPERPARLVPRWEAPRLDFPCLWRGFEEPGSRAGERFARSGSDPDRAGDAAAQPIAHRGGLACARPGTWRPTAIDQQRDQLTEVSVDLPDHLPRVVVYSSDTYDAPWTFDLERTLAANPDARPLPLPPWHAVVTVVEVPGMFGALPDDRGLEHLLAVDGARVVCQAEAPLRQFEPVELVCDPPPRAAPARYVVTGLWGDPNPEVAAIAITESSGRRYQLQPLGWELGVDAFYGTAPLETAFIRLRR